MNPAPAWTAAAAAQLQDGVNLVLSRWTALRMAVENGWGGHDSLQKSQQLGQSLFHHLTQSNVQVYMDDLEEILEVCLSSMNTQIEDGCIEEIAEKLMFLREECLEVVSNSGQPGINDDSSDDEDDNNMTEGNSMEMEVDTQQLQSNGSSVEEPAPEAVDGWTTVVSRRSRGRRN